MCSYIVLIFFALFALSFRKIRPTVTPDGEYISHDRTRAYNAFAMLLIILGHACIHVPGLAEANETYDSLYGGVFRIWAVGAFFFFSGYGIMESIRKSGRAYVRKLMCKRFPHVLFVLLALNLIPGIIGLSLYQNTTEQLLSRLSLTLGFTVGGPWFIHVTLLLYILTWATFTLFGTSNGKRAACALFVITFLVSFLLSPIRPWFWLDTILCFPLGMLLSANRAAFEQILQKCPIPHFIPGSLLILIGAWCSGHYWDFANKINFHLGTSGFYADFIKNTCGNISVLPLIIGGILCLGCIELKKPNRFLLWFGGPAVIYLYLLHFFPIQGITHTGLAHEQPGAATIIIVINSIILAFIAQSSVTCLFKLLPHKSA